MPRARILFLVLLTVLTCHDAPGHAEDPNGNRHAARHEQRNAKQSLENPFTLPADLAELKRISVVLGRPTGLSVTASIIAEKSGEAYIEYGTAPGNYSRATKVVQLQPERPVHVVLDQLPPNGQSYYRLRYREEGRGMFSEGREQTFHTHRPPGNRFVFEIQGDSHPERRHQFDPELYARTLRGAASDHPDFYILMGDDFSIDTLHVVNADTVTHRYRLQRPFLSLVGQASPLFLVNGNHEQAALANFDGTPDNVAVWAQNARHNFYPQPEPDGFYSGNPQPVAHIGLLRDYYAWQWGDALFVVIDPYWHSAQAVDNAFGGGGKNRDLWAVTLGERQYRWLTQTLESSRARYKFVFSHHVLGTGRGGVELAGHFEWGGLNRKGIYEFSQRRPGWEMPIHQLFVKHGVTIFFQGHDHVFARQEIDGVIYQTLPEPADPNYALGFKEAYHSGDILPNSGRVRVTVGPERARVEYVSSRLSTDVDSTHRDNEVVFTYDVAPANKRP